MDPLQKWNPGLISGSSQMPTTETSQEGAAASQPSSSEQLMMGLSDLSISPGSNPAVPLQEGLFQQQHREKTLLEQHWERLGFPQKKKAFLGHFRRRHRDHMAPYPVERETRISFPGDRAQNQFRCQCRYCQGHMPNISGVTGERNGNPSPSSWETLVQGLSGLTLSLGTNRPGIQPGGVQQQQQQQQQHVTSWPGKQVETLRLWEEAVKARKKEAANLCQTSTAATTPVTLTTPFNITSSVSSGTMSNPVTVAAAMSMRSPVNVSSAVNITSPMNIGHPVTITSPLSMTSPLTLTTPVNLPTPVTAPVNIAHPVTITSPMNLPTPMTLAAPLNIAMRPVESMPFLPQALPTSPPW